jgi:predicted transcriptional regulator
MTLRRVDPELDAILDVLTSRHRRDILYHLEDAETEVLRLAELVDAVQAGNPDPTNREAVMANLHHVQLPKLNEIGWIEYDFRSRTIRYRPEFVPGTILRFVRSTESPP